MDSCPQDAVTESTKAVNHYTAEVIRQSARDFGRTTTIAFMLGTVCLFGMLVYTRHSLITASGLYTVESKEGIIRTTPVFDRAHYFDDRVAITQSATARHLTTILNQTSTSFEFMGDVFNTTTTENGRKDLLANLSHYGILSKMYGTEVVQMNFVLKQTPIVVEPHYPDGTLKSDIENPETRNALPVNKWTIEVKGTISYGSILQAVRTQLPIVFTVDIIPTKDAYKMSSLLIDRVSLWELDR
ncbi:hypothetical protein KW429_11195 [Vibrio fluvialis]|nr:hypothetical protein [Vibrio fluvialis]MBY7902418.1 hypothetical protein [Vibrio fluvialis]